MAKLLKEEVNSNDDIKNNFLEKKREKWVFLANCLGKEEVRG